MDQCEDCSEVVCNTCSTLMSCKFCGCGLCEDCATACGRCGIVLCARDAKFAVECDTCRMSYCLVCLASGTKDPCVRCGHRPSKRVEQLVHLRLKSIYKAFKQSGASMGPGSGNGGGSGSNSGSSGGCRSDGSGRDGGTMGGKYSSALRSLTENVSSDTSKDNFSNFDQSMASEVAAVLQTASNSMANSDGGDFADGHSRRARGKRISTHDHSPNPGGGRNRSSSRASNAAAERYFRKTQAEIEAAAAAAEAEAEAAAAALLAELDEEQVSSTAANSKKSKKKKKKKDRKKEAAAELQEDTAFETPDTDNFTSADKDDTNSSALKKKGTKKTPLKRSNDPPPIEDDSSDEEMNFDLLVSRATSTRPSKKEKKEENSEEKALAPPPEPKPEPPPPVEVAPIPATTADFDAELAILLSNEDEEGLETFLANLKGVPGLGAARKTAKKALKKIKEVRQLSIPTEPEKPLTQSSNANPSATSMETEMKSAKSAAKATAPKQSSRAASATSIATAANPTPPTSTGTQHEPLLRVVSRTQSNLGTTSSRGGASNSASVPASARAECVMHMSPNVVGWVIGKGGSRIRDMMEESGAKIWIDQESMGAKEARVVYVSGKRTSVDSAVRMVKDLVAKAPVAASAAASHGVAPAPAPASSAAKSAPVPASTPTVQNPSAPEAAKEPASFAAAITSGSSTPATVTSPGPKPSTPSKQSASTQSWALPASGGNASVAPPPPQAAPQSVKAAPKPAVTNAAEVGGGKFPPGTVTAELGCDPRFVALLIGRRGWTVKNIQAESGAELHIDQAVDPPKIIIFGQIENVKKAEQMVRDVLKYPHAQLHQEVVPQQPNRDIMGSVDNSMGMASGRPEHNVGDLQMMPPTNLHRDVSSSTPKLLEELQLQQESSHQTKNLQAEGAMNFPRGYAQYQQQNPNNLGLFQDSSATRISDFLPNDQHQSLPPPSVNVDPSARSQRQEWNHHNQAPVRTQYSALPPFSSAQGSTTDQYMLSNPNAPLAHSPQDNRRPSTFVLPPEQHLHFPQNLEAVPQAPMPPAQVPSTRMNDFMSTGSTGHNANGWELPANGNAMGGSWNQSHHASVPSNHQQQPAFQAQAAQPLSNNPFRQQTQNHHDITASSQPTSSHRVSDDSLMVDNMFASLGTAESDGGGLLNAMNSVSLGGGAASQQQQGNWGSKITGWTGDDSNPFLHNSRLGDYREE